MYAKLPGAVSVLTMTMAIGLASQTDAHANPLEFGGAPIQIRVAPVIPVVPTRIAPSEAINVNFGPTYFNVTGNYDDAEPLQSQGEDEDDDDLSGLFGEQDPAETALKEKRDKLDARRQTLESALAKLVKAFLDSDDGTDAKGKIGKLDEQLGKDLKKITQTAHKMREAAKQDALKNDPAGVACCVDRTIYDAADKYETLTKGKVVDAYKDKVDKALRKAMNQSDPKTLESYNDLKDAIKEVKTEQAKVDAKLSEFQTASD